MLFLSLSLSFSHTHAHFLTNIRICIFTHRNTRTYERANSTTHPHILLLRIHAHFMQILVFLGSLLVASLASSLIWEFVYGEVSNTVLVVVCCAQASSGICLPLYVMCVVNLRNLHCITEHHIDVTVVSK